jgi:SAM-dependent methyltransferase
MSKKPNLDMSTVSGFGREWQEFDQSEVSELELRTFFEDYFSLVDLKTLSSQSIVMDVGCGSGRWANFLAPMVGTLHLVDPSDQALRVARIKLNGFDNCAFHNVSTESLPGDDESCDFIYSLGVLHHIPDTQSAIIDCVKKLKPGAPFLVYLYYRFDNKKWWFRSLWFVSNIFRSILSRCPFFLKKRLTDFIALLVYFPLARLAKLMSRRGRDVSSFPLSFYRDSSLYTMRTDSLDRFGTRLEHRFTKIEVRRMLENAGLIDIRFREAEPFWCAIGTKRP